MIDAQDAPGVPIRPPYVLLALIGLSGFLEWAMPLGAGPFGGGAFAFAGGALLIAAGMLTAALGLKGLVSAGTTFHTDAPNTALVVSGIYRHSRNPIYIGLILVYAGLAAIIASPWALVFLPVFVYFLRYFAIGREEAYLLRRFGQPYRDYMDRVPRWF